jgi:MFS family permease
MPDVVAEQARPRAAMSLWKGIYAASISLLPVFLFGAVSSQIRQELGLSLGVMGAAVSLHFAVSAIFVSFSGRFADDRGVAAAMRAGGLATIAGSLIIAATTTGSVNLFIGLALCGLGNSLVSPATSRLIFHAARRGRRGLMFGVKQASISVGIGAAGLALPTLADAYGWRSTFVFTVLLAVPFLLRPPPDFKPEIAPVEVSGGQTSPASPGAARVPARTPSQASADAPQDAASVLLLEAIVFGFAIASLLTLSTYVVDLLVTVGYPVGSAGVVLSVGAAGSVVLRLGLGWFVDHRPNLAMPVTALCLLLGSLGFVVMSVGAVGALPAVVVAAAVFVAFTMGWGWTGLVLFDIAHNNPLSVARSTGMVFIGAGLGGSLGPALFGQLFQRAGPVTLWAAAGTSMFLAALAATIAVRVRSSTRSSSDDRT